MVCVYCSNETKVTNSRLQKRNNQVWRRRQCEVCEAIFTTHEAVDLSQTLIVDYGGSQRPFSDDLLFTHLLDAMRDRKDRYVDAREITSTVIHRLLKHPENPLFSPKTISNITAQVLKRFDKQSWLRYTAEHPSLQR